MKRACLEFSRRAVIALASASLSGVVLTAERAAAGEEPAAAARSFAQPALRPPAAVETTEAPALRPSQSDEIVRVTQPPASARPAAAIATPAQEPPTWPKMLPEAKMPSGDTPVEPFSAQDITAAKSRCSALLKGLDVVVLEEAPIKSGVCGAPAPVQLISLGKNPQVALSPPATMTCEMVAALHQWVTQDLQSLAKKHFGSSIVSIETMSSYSCRNAYGRRRGNLSEHGRANALDIRGFQTASAQEANLLADWGPTASEIKAQIAAAAKAAADKLAADKAAKAKADQLAASKAPAAIAPAGAAPASTAPAQPSSGNKLPSIGSIVEGVPAGIADRLPGAAPAAEGRTGYGLIRPSQLGGPKVPPEKTGSPQSPTAPVPPDLTTQSRKTQFLRGAHTSACRIFGTTLGPETNLAHKNHIHVDMAERAPGKNYCE
jgi:hypothetical protein